MHASRNLLRLTTMTVCLLMAACGSTPGSNASDAGCATSTCSGDSACPTLTCLCNVVGLIDAGGESMQTRMIPGECSSGCCAPCPDTCN